MMYESSLGTYPIAEKNMLKVIGFKVLLAWHYLVLFSPLLIGSLNAETFPFFFERQLTLYVTLAVSFVSLAVLGKFFLRKNKTMPSATFLIFIGVLATATTLFTVGLIDSSSVELRLVVTVLLGISEAFLMFLWLQYYQVVAGDTLYRSFANDMIFGALIAFLVCVLQYPFSLLVLVILPLVASLSLVLNWRSIQPRSVQREKQEEEQKERVQKNYSRQVMIKDFLKSAVPTIVFAFVFGLLQGAYIEEGEIALLMATSPVIILGITVCGILLFLIREDRENRSDIDLMYRLSMLFFVFGIVGLAFLNNPSVAVASETAIMAGFNLFDFGGMVMTIGIAKYYPKINCILVEGGRSLTYAGLALGLLCGYLMMQSVEGDDYVLLGASGFAIILLVATSLTPFQLREGTRVKTAVFYTFMQGTQEVAENEEEKAAKNETQKSPAEQSSLASSGQKTTKITVKTPYAKEEKKEISGESYVKNPKRADTPFKRVCNEIADVYRLSPREREIFMLISKGRNAEYVQQKLVISTHTAKTHIANIYHKLGVHSVQEMLNLIETFKDQEKEKHTLSKR